MAVLDKAEADRCCKLARERGQAVIVAEGTLLTLVPAVPVERTWGGLISIVFQRRVSSVRLARRAAKRVPQLIEQFEIPPERALEMAEEYAQAEWRYAQRRAGVRLT